MKLLLDARRAGMLRARPSDLPTFRPSDPQLRIGKEDVLATSVRTIALAAAATLLLSPSQSSPATAAPDAAAAPAPPPAAKPGPHVFADYRTEKAGAVHHIRP